MNSKIVFLLLLFISNICLLEANISKELNRYFKNVNSSINVNGGDIYNGQRAGYATGGGAVVRNRVMNTKVATISLPKFDAGCGGIDIFTGGISFINGEQIVNTLKSIASGAAGFAFLLSAECVSPQAVNCMKQLQSWANTINSMNINSCEIATQAVGAVWPKNTAASQQICRTLSGKTGLFNDQVSARHKCSQSEEFEVVIEGMEKNGTLGNVLVGEFNIAWEAIKKHPSLSTSNNDLKEFFMSLMGTIVSVKTKDVLENQFWQSRIFDESFLQVILNGGHTTIYARENDFNDKALHLREYNFEISPEDSWIGKIKFLLEGIQNKIIHDDACLTEEEKDLIFKTRFPLFKIINVLTVYKKGTSPVDLIQIAEVIAVDLLVTYLREVKQIVHEGCVQLRKHQYFSDNIDEYLLELEKVERKINEYKLRSSDLFEKEFRMIEKINLIEQEIASQVRLD
ncbi:conjugal transfer pilus assembly protein TraH [Candidatus Rubidus massiliensis]|nr:conjugal transfer pilus assembly protein TraH [Candidatus Rubidus massiliensis]